MIVRWSVDGDGWRVKCSQFCSLTRLSVVFFFRLWASVSSTSWWLLLMGTCADLDRTESGSTAEHTNQRPEFF